MNIVKKLEGIFKLATTVLNTELKKKPMLTKLNKQPSGKMTKTTTTTITTTKLAGDCKEKSSIKETNEEATQKVTSL